MKNLLTSILLIIIFPSVLFPQGYKQIKRDSYVETEITFRRLISDTYGITESGKREFVKHNWVEKKRNTTLKLFKSELDNKQYAYWLPENTMPLFKYDSYTNDWVLIYDSYNWKNAKFIIPNVKDFKDIRHYHIARYLNDDVWIMNIKLEDWDEDEEWFDIITTDGGETFTKVK